jgi:hypothetical protein
VRSSTPAAARPAAAPVLLGLGTPWGGRLFRGLFAVAALWYRIDRDSRLDGGYFLRTVLWFAVIAAALIVVHLLMSRFVYDRVSPWVSTGILQLPLLVYPLGIGADAFHDGLGLYTLLGLVLNPLLGYGGAEVIALPTLLTRRRHRTYTPFNLVDQVEMALRDEGHRRGPTWVVAVAAFAVGLLALWILPLLLAIDPVHDRLPGLEVSPLWAPAFLIPAALLGIWYARDRRVLGARDATVVRKGWAVLALLALAAAGSQVPDVLWGGIILAGLAVGVRSLVRRRA